MTALTFGYLLLVIVFNLIPGIGPVLLPILLPALTAMLGNGCRTIEAGRMLTWPMLSAGLSGRRVAMIRLGGIHLAGSSVLVLASLFLILADTKSVSLNIMKFEIAVILALAVSNFFLMSQMLTKRKMLDAVMYVMSAADLAVISLIIVAQGGFESNVYTFYFPAMLAFSVAMPTFMLYLFLGGTMSIYAFICIVDLNVGVGDLQTITLRLLMLAAVAVCGNYFARLESRRRNALLQREALTTSLIEPVTPAPSQSTAQ